MRKNKLSVLYEITMFTLAVYSISFIWSNDPRFPWLDTLVWAIFVIDVSYRLYRAEHKWKFVKENPFDFIAIIPFDSLFRLARVVRLLRVFKVIVIAKRFSTPVIAILKTNHLHRVLVFTGGLIGVSSIFIYFSEPNIETFEEAIWWGIVTSTTVGYGDFAPETTVGRAVAVVLMLVGIGLIGMITSAITTYFVKNNEEKNEEVGINHADGTDSSANRADHAAMVKGPLKQLDEQDVSLLIELLEEMRQRKNNRDIGL